MIPRFDDVLDVKDGSVAPCHRNGRRLPRRQRQHECSGKAKRQLVKRNTPSSSGAADLRISSPNTFTRNESKLEISKIRHHSPSTFSRFGIK
ncbi:unnamed protein product [Protopolystoma xenopodis]|uniref:Uncharacterized protein n=1 Tax=Protopolystoma xenopodis TaxID=117903 RepID=A0A448WP26_9PLAT|nr:unnamed protein product [Protopolystoma xenopodis]